MKMLNVALPKGRLGEKVYDMFEKAGFACPSIKENNRKLIFENEQVGVRYFGLSRQTLQFTLNVALQTLALQVKIF